MPNLTPEAAALASASLWVVHTVDCANYGRQVLTGPPTPDGEPSCADDLETAILHRYATALTERLNERAERMGLHPDEVAAGLEFCVRMPWDKMQRDYLNAVNYIGGKLRV